MHEHHRRAAAVVSAAAVLDAGLGAWFGAADHIGAWNGVYFATSVATTAGNSPFYPHGWAPYVLAMVMHLVVVPLWLGTFSLITSGLTSTQVQVHVQASEARLRRHVEERLRRHPGQD